MGIKHVDVIVDLQYGDTGKGKVAHHLAGTKEYDYVLRYNGGSNAGHTVYHNGKKVVTHQVPVGVLHKVKSIIGPGCVVSLDKLHQEIEEIKSAGMQVRGYLFIDKRAHIVTQSHLAEDSKDTQIGTTKQGIGPAYTSKYARTGCRIGDIDLTETLPDVLVIDVYDILFNDPAAYTILCEGAQGFYLDIDWGDYPYVTSSHCTVGSVCLNGIPPHKIRKVYGVMKAYETYVGNKTTYTDESDETFKAIQKAGNEFGATTGRPRKVNWTSIDNVIRAANINGVTNLIINKLDVLEQVNEFGLIVDNSVVKYSSSHSFQFAIDKYLMKCNTKPQIIWSKTPNGI